MKNKSSYVCNSCSYKSVKWLGCCPSCKSWESFEEKSIERAIFGGKSKEHETRTYSVRLINIHDLKEESLERMVSGVEEWDRVMGGGIMPGSLIVLTGDPGIGKSTLLLQICSALAESYKTFYFSTEESINQVSQRAARLGCSSHLFFSDSAELTSIIQSAQNEKPDLLIIDSIQNCYIEGARTTNGSSAQLREAIFELMRLAKENQITVIITGHITKEGVIAGPKTIEHMVDAVFYLQGEDRWQTRVLRAVKNRFGTINELGFFEMQQHGLIQVPNINEQLLEHLTNNPGSILTCTLEGSRPLLLELQALTIESKLAIPQRVISGIDHKQVILIAAILEKYLKVKLSTQDIFFKVSGGFKIKRYTSDLAIALALLSSYFKQPLPEKTIALAEISLTGQIKPINLAHVLLKEAEKFGISHAFVASKQKLETAARQFNHVYELLKIFEL